MARRLISFTLTVGVAGLAVLGAFLLGGLRDHAESDTALPAASPTDDAPPAGGWFPTDAVKHGDLLALDDDGRALVAFYDDYDVRSVDVGLSTDEVVFGERPGIAIVDKSGGVTVLAEPVPIDPESWGWPRGDINGDMAAWDYIAGPYSYGGNMPQTIWVSRGGGSPVAVKPLAADGSWLELQANPNYYVTGDYLIGTSYGGGAVMVSIETGLAAVLEPHAEGGLVPWWIHRDLCAEASGGEAYTFLLNLEGGPGLNFEQWTMTLEVDGTRTLRQIPLVTEMEMGIPTTACGDNGANGVELSTGGTAVGYRTGDTLKVVQGGNSATTPMCTCPRTTSWACPLGSTTPDSSSAASS